MLYEIKNLVKRYKDRKVLDLTDFSIEKGKIFGLVGPNGAGKTTLLEILAFILKPDEGELFYNEKRVTYLNSTLHQTRKSVVLLQQAPVLFTASVYKNMEFPLKIRKIGKQKREEIIDDLLEIVGMTAFKHSQGNTLSGGETQRVAIAMALACSPEVILLDEPTASVDVENQSGIENIIKQINKKRGISIIFTSHDMLQISRIADDMIYINNGKISDSIHENIFSGAIKRESVITIREGLNLPVDTCLKGPVRISIDPLKIKIKKDLGAGSDNIHQFKGRILQLTCEGKRVRMLVDIKIPLTLLMDNEEYKLSGAGIGDMVFIDFLKDSIQFI